MGTVCSFSPSSLGMVAVACGRALMLWDASTSKVVAKLRKDGHRARRDDIDRGVCYWSEDGREILTAHTADWDHKWRALRLWNLSVAAFGPVRWKLRCMRALFGAGRAEVASQGQRARLMLHLMEAPEAIFEYIMDLI